MFGKSGRQIKNVTFVQPIEGEVFFYTPIAFSRVERGKQVFKDSDLALAGKLKLIFERERKCWFEIREEKSTTSLRNEHSFVLYFYPQRLVASRNPSFEVKATLQRVKELFDFIVTEEQDRLVEVHQSKIPLAYTSIEEELREELETATLMAEEPYEESDALIEESEQH